MNGQFYLLAKQFCNFIESETIDHDSLEELTILLLGLYQSGLRLSYTDDFEEDMEKESAIVHPKIQVRDCYHMIYDPFAENPNEELADGTLTEDLQDIYSDLQKGIFEYEAGQINNACFEWRLGLDNHWGIHLVNALTALHWIRTKYSDQ